MKGKTFKPTLGEPKSNQADEFKDDFNKQMMVSKSKISEVDGKLNEKEESLKKKIFNLSKMESLVHSDPKLSVVYEEMSENGEEKYGYHYNETIMNIIFNDYVLNSPKYLQKYKNAIPKKKKRRDKSGINQLKTGGKDKEKNNDDKKNTKDMKDNKNISDKEKNEKNNDDKSVDETTTAGSAAGAGETYVGYAGPAAWSKSGKPAKDKPYYDGGNVINEDNYLINPNKFMKMMINEHHLDTRDEKINFILQNVGGEMPKEVFDDMPDEDIDTLYNELEQSMGLYEESKSKAQQKFMGMVHALKKGEIKPSDVSKEVEKAADSMSDKEAEDFASTKHEDLPEKVDEEKIDEHHLESRGDKIDFIVKNHPELGDVSSENLMKMSDDEIHNLYLKTEDILRNKGIDPMSDDVNESMIDDNEDSMKMSNPINSDSNMPSGMDSGGPMNEEDDDDYFKKLESELNEYNEYIDGLNEDRKPSSLVMKDRLGNQNTKNFKKDLSHSGTKEIVDTMNNLEYDEQQTVVGDEPYKNGEEIEREALKRTNGDAFENVGNSTNKDGNEIPKRNLTDDEASEVDLYRQGLGDYIYDNKPDERFEERMKNDMGEENYEKRQKRMDFKSKAPMYNKDSQPIDDGIDKVQYEKDKTEWNDRFGVNESQITGKFVNDLNRNQLITFKLNECKFVDNINDLHELNFNGLGNKYDKFGSLNESVDSAINSFKYYTDGKDVFVTSIEKKNLNESEVKENKTSLNENLNKIGHLMNYNPRDYIKNNR